MSDAYDPEFGTAANAEAVRDSLRTLVKVLGKRLGREPQDIVGVAQGPPGRKYSGEPCERTLRLVRFGLNRALESL
ncbi:MAG: hypothetical protein GY778_13515 [bacterium]|nr:hypothetical protein [bacterium]